jgi:hypothetical protein
MTPLNSVEELPLAVPDPEALRDRLAVVLTEAALLRAQIRVSERLRKERERLRRRRDDARGAPTEAPETT